MNHNTIAAYHILGTENGKLRLETRKLFHWHIPKALREPPIQTGDIVVARTARGKRAVRVMDVFREDIEDTGKIYRSINKIIERASQS